MIQTVIPYLTFNGEAGGALEFYKKVFQAEITNTRYFHEMEGFSGDKFLGERILHARLTKDTHDLFYFSDTLDDETDAGNRLSVAVIFDTEESFVHAFALLSKTGTIEIPIQEIYGGSKYCQLIDHYSIHWHLSFEKQTTTKV
ncbi:glyoxalase/bleomycin resistance/extradiol dioxygenase family protein [Listeria ivanovii]|uniref:Glyoxalase/bleomycin resistance/extradiol dioxygenase family protein n=2 Tax=Listeria ivanovii TaxID=1638 RepID=A0ABS1G4N3_LISIV|nr:glyoxalase/bleomycin resistance/extradiol dioxygenase family protein [Listeria ivanovii]EFR96719.1 glyoxalase/bleomycin resistance protein/dioxygenase family protein [Listeria ivanovii FSL F6-596]AIS60043.1 glyoxalase [Listeria ivanovii subsp. londoniensis]MBK1961839.1 glyoxalase/bleomycin resistance/extradiol dioxygenase family protein [Listeria ivanovii subsp. londoniensis]MBM5608458.1 glyoxalase/bleomycin resistance/extradiol dioxygenase family protein [Listeria ivanovii]MBM5636593.1 gly